MICGNGPHNGYRIDSHHIIERRLFVDPHQFGGYFLDNGATLSAEDVNSCGEVKEENSQVR
ncbi:MAG TPA: hypothetical protein VLJ39_19300 [Tepidisphaeraceae bacterium]|nr:hypothetical protein [Tepidisphaeraceae bacterium]